MWDWVDLVIIAIIALSVITGLIRGFVKELVAVCVWILAIWLALNYSQALDPWLQNYIQDKTARSVVGFIAILLGTLIAGGITNAILGFIMKRTGLSGTDRILGMGFGFVRGVFIVALIMLVIKMTSLPYQQYSSNSVLYAKFDPVVNWLYGMMPNFINQVKMLDRHIVSQELPKIFDKASLPKFPDFEFSDA